MEKISEIIRRRLLDSGETMYSVAQATGVDQATLSRWLRGERGVSVDTLDRLAEHLGLTVRPRRHRKGMDAEYDV